MNYLRNLAPGQPVRQALVRYGASHPSVIRFDWAMPLRPAIHLLTKSTHSVTGSVMHRCCFPLYPQYGPAATTALVEMTRRFFRPEWTCAGSLCIEDSPALFMMIPGLYRWGKSPAMRSHIARSSDWEPGRILLMSVPRHSRESVFSQGDSLSCQCLKTARLVAVSGWVGQRKKLMPDIPSRASTRRVASNLLTDKTVEGSSLRMAVSANSAVINPGFVSGLPGDA